MDNTRIKKNILNDNQNGDSPDRNNLSNSKKSFRDSFPVRFHQGLLRIRLVIAGPLLTSLLVLLSGILIIRIFEVKLMKAGFPESALSEISITIQMTLLISTIIAGVAGFLLSYVIVKPLRRMMETVQNVATGKLTPTVLVPSHLEIDALQSSFNKMVTSLSGFVHERNKYILESLAGALVTLDSLGNITTINKSAEMLLDLEPDTGMGKTIFDILMDVPENQRIRIMFRNSLNYNLTYSSEEVLLSTKKRDKLPIGITISPLQDKSEQLVGVVATFKDLSKIKQIQQQLHRSDRLAAIGTLATGLAHEIRNPLGSMRGLAQLLSEDLTIDDPKSRYAQVIIKEIDRLNHVVQELLMFSQVSAGGMDYVDINVVIRDVVFIGRQNPKTKSDIQIIELYDTQIPLLKIEKEKMIQALLNIIMNALEAAGESEDKNRMVEIRTSLSNARRDYLVPNLGFVLIEISNTGPPIRPEHIDRIFDPFFTTKESGTGLGLAIAYQIIASHSGMIEVNSGENQKTIFQIHLPIIKESEESALASI